jgi:hypothetical protein
MDKSNLGDEIGQNRVSSPSQEWEIVKRTNSNSSSVRKMKIGTYNLVVGFLEVLRHAVVLLPDTDVQIVLNEEVC